MTSSRHVVVVGGGVIGLSCALPLLERGHSVTLVERGGPDHDCCSLGNGGKSPLRPVSETTQTALASPGILPSRTSRARPATVIAPVGPLQMPSARAS